MSEVLCQLMTCVYGMNRWEAEASFNLICGLSDGRREKTIGFHCRNFAKDSKSSPKRIRMDGFKKMQKSMKASQLRLKD